MKAAVRTREALQGSSGVALGLNGRLRGMYFAKTQLRCDGEPEIRRVTKTLR